MGPQQQSSRNASRVGEGGSPPLPSPTCCLSWVHLCALWLALPLMLFQPTPFLNLRRLASPAHPTGTYWAPAVCQVLCWALGHDNE